MPLKAPQEALRKPSVHEKNYFLDEFGFTPNWYELRKQEEFPSLASSRNIFFQDSMCLAKYQINPIDVNFHLQKSLEIFDTNSADKIPSQNYKVVKVS